MQTSAFSTNGATPKEHIVVALGGNAWLKRKEAMTMENQRQNIVKGMTSLHNVLNDYKVTVSITPRFNNFMLSSLHNFHCHWSFSL
jgi:hypothetical protein